MAALIRPRRTAGVATVVALAAMPAGAHAAAYAIDAHSAAAAGRAGCAAATVSGSEAVQANPAGLVDVGGISVQAGAGVVIPRFGHAQPGGRPAGQLADGGAFATPAVFAAASLNENIAVGLGLYSPAWFSVRWPSDFEGRFKGLATEIQSVAVAPTLAYRVAPEASLGFGIALTKVSFLHERALDFADSEGRLRVGGGTWTVAFNGGVQSTLAGGRVRLGLAARSGAAASVDGRADFTVPPEFESMARDQPAVTAVHLPGQLVLAVAGRPLEALTVSAEGAIGLWASQAPFAVRFPEQPSLDVDEDRTLVTTFAVRAGGEYAFDRLNLRAGVGYDPSPVEATGLTAVLPDGDRISLALGAGYGVSLGGGETPYRLAVDAAYTLVAVRTKVAESPAPAGSFAGSAHQLGLTVTFLWAR